jgi:formiminotetrahydrofolate cyclodeaminase
VGLDEAAARLRPLRVTLSELVDRDAAAYASVVDAYRLPRDTVDQSATRRRAIAEAMRTATETPLDTMRAGQQALAEAWIVASRGARSASSDVAVAIELLLTAVRGAALNVDVNLGAVGDETFVQRVKGERRQLEDTSASDAERARAHL